MKLALSETPETGFLETRPKYSPCVSGTISADSDLGLCGVVPTFGLGTRLILPFETSFTQSSDVPVFTLFLGSPQVTIQFLSLSHRGWGYLTKLWLSFKVLPLGVDKSHRALSRI